VPVQVRPRAPFVFYVFKSKLQMFDLLFYL
jgi:hypothetical protein